MGSQGIEFGHGVEAVCALFLVLVLLGRGGGAKQGWACGMQELLVLFLVLFAAGLWWGGHLKVPQTFLTQINLLVTQGKETSFAAAAAVQVGPLNRCSPSGLCTFLSLDCPCAGDAADTSRDRQERKGEIRDRII